MASGQDHIEHVVVLMLENMSFDRLLGTFPGVRGVDPAALRTNVDPSTQAAIAQRPTQARVNVRDPPHEHPDVLAQIAENNSGFVANFVAQNLDSTADERAEVMAYYEQGSLPVLHTLARSFAVADAWHASLCGPTWPNRFFVHSGTSLGHVDMPVGPLEPNLHHYDQTTVYNRLEEAGISWRIYVGDVPQALVMTDLLPHGARFDRMDEFYEAARGAPASFPQYAFIEPSYFINQNDQHPPSDVLAGEALIASVYNALAANDALFASTLLVVLYDEHGGFFDHVPPPPCVAPDAHTQSYAFDRLGVRVPAVLISPWLDAQILRDVYDHTSLLRYVSDKWRLGALGARTAAANSFGPALRVRTSPRTDYPRSIPVPQIQKHRESGLSGNQRALLELCRSLGDAVDDSVESAIEVFRKFTAKAKAKAGGCCALL